MKDEALNIIAVILICVVNVLIQKTTDIRFVIAIIISLAVGIVFRFGIGFIINKKN